MSLATVAQTTGTTSRAGRSLRGPVTQVVICAVLAVFLLVRMPSGQTAFRIATSSDLVELPNLSVPAAPVAWLFVLVAATLATVNLVRALREGTRLGAWSPAAIGVLLILVFLTDAGAGSTSVVPLTGILAGTLFLSTPLIFGALSGVLSERAGVINIAIEGQLLAGAFLAAVVASITTSAYFGLVAAPIAGATVGLLLAFFSIRYQVNQLIVGIVLNVLVLGLTNFLFSTVLADNPALNQRQGLPVIAIPGLSQIPIVGPVLFRQTVLVYLMYAVVVALQIYLFRSRWGLRVRSVGEHPKAADTVGIDVNRTRWRNVVFASAIAGLGGAFFTVASGLAFGKDMTAGRGFIALAAMILGRWSPKGAVAAALLFGFADNLRTVLPNLGASVPPQILLMIPYIVTILAVAGFAGRMRPPAAEGVPYVK